MSYWKLGCRWGSKTQGKPLFYKLLTKYQIVIGWENKDYKKDATILLTDGHTALGIAKTISSRKSVLDFPKLKEEFEEFEIDYCTDLYVYESCILDLLETEQFQFKTQVGICGIDKQEIRDKINYLLSYNQKKLMTNSVKNNYKSLLQYKKQIILQGPPGTGKTKLAKEIAEELIGFTETQISKSQTNITVNEIKRFISPGQKINSAADYTEYTIQELGENNVTVKLKDVGTTYKPSFKEIINAYEIKMWEGKQVKGNDPYAAAIAKYIYSQNRFGGNNVGAHEQFKLIQFHPSYTYEDLVRGIVAKPNPEGGEGVFYEAVDKTIGKFAKEALNNYKLSQAEDTEDYTIENFDSFLSYVLEQLDLNEKYMISDKVYIFSSDDKRFKYKGDNWTAHPNGLNMNYSELQKIISLRLQSRQDINKNKGLNALTRQHATYYQNVVELYREHINKTPLPKNEKSALKNYVLIIDEINRANLSSVLGELIYALEYRGEAVESMYEIERDGEKSNNLVLPPNLYIIGTMNTADRSVGHIDYAIRRRFAFVDVQPEKLEDSDALIFHADLFKRVAGLFISNYDDYLHDKSTPLKKAGYLSPEFEAKDVWLGHSYFIQKKIKGTGQLEPQDFGIRVKYEIVPILREYVKDGVLNENAVQIINEIEKECF